jgi:addiction module HigA family antidote
MLPSNRIATHPGVILQKEFLEPLGQTQRALAAHIGVPVQRINEIVRGKRGISPETAWLLSQALGTTPEFWLNLQANHDLSSTWTASCFRGARTGRPMSPAKWRPIRTIR